MKDIDNIRILCAEIVQKAKSGHPGAPMGLAQFVHILYSEFLVLDPRNSKNPLRDIFILSNGHACVIQYVMNHFLGFLDIEDLKQFRQLGSKTPGHPEKNDFSIEISTGPLGQGVAASIGFAISSKIAKIQNHIYCIFGDGCYQEGISQEAFSLCSKLRLNNITFIYDFNKTTIDGSTELSMNENVVLRFKSLNFDVVEVDGNDSESIRNALKHKSTRPKVIILHTQIGKDSELENSCKSHGSPLGEENIKKLREKYNLFEDPFYISEEIKIIYSKAKERMISEIDNRPKCSAENIEEITCKYENDYVSESLATRKHFFNALNSLVTNKRIISGCADLTPSVLSQKTNSVDFENCDQNNFPQNIYLRFGIREHSMCAVMNGIAAHGFFVPMGGTFLNFISYGFPSVRLAALDKLKVIYVLTHDSILLGEDGPTHQPIEVLANLRATPGLTTLRPCDGRETRAALSVALKIEGPVAIILTRQKVAEIEETGVNYINPNEPSNKMMKLEPEISKGVMRGAYFLIDEKDPEIILLATGSEVELAYKVREKLKSKKVSIVSFISWELFEKQPIEYKNKILNRNALKVSIEALSTFGWSKYSDLQIGQDEFGESAPGQAVYEHFGFTAEKISQKITDYLTSVNIKNC